ncbi:DUF6207 family protein [Streptomyces afghaniensis]
MTTRPCSPFRNCSSGGGPPRPRTVRPGHPGEPGVRLRCYLDVRQELRS